MKYFDTVSGYWVETKYGDGSFRSSERFMSVWSAIYRTIELFLHKKENGCGNIRINKIDYRKILGKERYDRLYKQ